MRKLQLFGPVVLSTCLAGKPLHSLQPFLILLCSQIPAPPQSRQVYFLRLCSQMSDPPHRRQLYLFFLCSHTPGFIEHAEVNSFHAITKTQPAAILALLVLAHPWRTRAVNAQTFQGTHKEHQEHTWRIRAVNARILSPPMFAEDLSVAEGATLARLAPCQKFSKVSALVVS